MKVELIDRHAHMALNVEFEVGSSPVSPPMQIDVLIQIEAEASAHMATMMEIVKGKLEQCLEASVTEFFSKVYSETTSEKPVGPRVVPFEKVSNDVEVPQVPDVDGQGS
jgi:hypothetical protein